MKCYGNYFNASGSRAEHMVSDATFVLKAALSIMIEQTKFSLGMKTYDYLVTQLLDIDMSNVASTSVITSMELLMKFLTIKI